MQNKQKFEDITPKITRFTEGFQTTGDTIENIPGGGTRVTFTLPVRKEETEDGSDHTAG